MARARHAYPSAAAEVASLFWMSPMVIGARMTQFWLAGMNPSASDRNEAARMVTEKMQAASESMMAMNVAASKALMDTMMAATQIGGKSADGSFDAILSAGLRPYSKRVKANRKRLSR